MFEGSVGHTAAVTIGTPHSRAVTLPPQERCRRDISRRTRAHTSVAVEERGVTSAQVHEQIIVLSWRKSVGVQETSQEHRSGAEQRFQRITWEAEPLILEMTAEAVQSVPYMEVCLCLRQLKETVEEDGATAGMHHAPSFEQVVD